MYNPAARKINKRREDKQPVSREHTQTNKRPNRLAQAAGAAVTGCGAASRGPGSNSFEVWWAGVT